MRDCIPSRVTPGNELSQCLGFDFIIWKRGAGIWICGREEVVQDIFAVWICWVCFSFVDCCYSDFTEGCGSFGASAEEGVEEEIGRPC
jgi:hypothetical protein